MTVTYGLIDNATQDPGTFYSGIAKEIDLSGSAFSPSATVVGYINRPKHPEQFSMRLQCSGIANASTDNDITVKFYHKGSLLSESTSKGCHEKDYFISAKTTSIDKVTVTTDGKDAMWIDYAILSAPTKGKPVHWGMKGGKGYCVSTDRKDAASWKKEHKIDKHGCYGKVGFIASPKVKAVGYGK